jgi:hypothetical protein
MLSLASTFVEDYYYCKVILSSTPPPLGTPICHLSLCATFIAFSVFVAAAANMTKRVTYSCVCNSVSVFVAAAAHMKEHFTYLCVSTSVTPLAALLFVASATCMAKCDTYSFMPTSGTRFTALPFVASAAYMTQHAT